MSLTDEQLKVVQSYDNKMCIIATAGSGKTRLIIERVKELENRGVNMDKVLILSFSRESSKELMKRYRKVSDKNIFISTVHSFCLNTIKKLQMNGKISQEISLNEEYCSCLFKQSCGNKSNEDIKEIRLSIDNDINRCKNEDEYEHKEIYKKYTELKKSENLIDYNDLLTIFIENKDNIKSEFEYIIVDEFQDITPLHFEIIKHITNENLMVVGDDDQNIYSWKGSTIDIILNIKEVYNDINIYYLSYNFRCPENILNTAIKVIKHNRRRYDKTIIPYNKGGIINVKEGFNEETYIENLKRNENMEQFILVRTSQEMAILSDILCRYGIKVDITSPNKPENLEEYRNVDNILKVYRALQDPTDIEKVKQMLGVLNQGTTLITLINKMRFSGKPFWEVWDNSIGRMLKSAYDTNNKNMFMQIIRNPSRYDNLMGYLYNLDMNLKEFITHISTSKQRLMNIKTKETNIRLMTYHASKGLEGDIVYNMFVNTQNFDKYNEESIRILYVGMTRAKKELYVYTMGVKPDFI